MVRNKAYSRDAHAKRAGTAAAPSRLMHRRSRGYINRSMERRAAQSGWGDETVSREQIKMSESNRTPYIRTALPADAEVVVAMAAELAAAGEGPAPNFDAARFVRDGFGPDRWFECLIAEIEHEPVGYALICRGFEAHTGKRRLWLGDLYVRATARLSGTGRALMAAVASRARDLD